MKPNVIKWSAWPITVLLSIILCLHVSLARSQESTNDPPNMVANCEDIPKQKGNIAFGVVIAIIGAIFFYGIYKCAKKIDQKPPPTPPPPIPPPGYGTNCNPNHPDWPCTNLHPIPRKMSLAGYSGASDFSGVRDSMTGLAHSSSNAFISLYDWSENATALDDDLVPYNMWYEGVLPVKVSGDLRDWHRSLTVTGWISPTGVKSVYYDEGVPLLTNFIRTVDPWSIPGYDATTNIDLVEIPRPVRLNVPQRFFLTLSTNW